MLSICIPIYNYDVKELVSELYQQAVKLNVAFEIFCIDDCSKDEIKAKNAETCCRCGKYIELKENIGRSKIRNLFLNYAQYKYLLFLDCDSVVNSHFFLSNYISVIKNENPQVVCGGRVYPEAKPAKNKLLRWKYGHLKESQPAEIRKLKPNKSFMTNNFVISRKLFEKIRFDERLSQYGHEDTLFGFQLKKAGIPVLHIDNPILNGELEDNKLFIEKTEQGLINLHKILEFSENEPELIEDITILKAFNKLKNRKLIVIINIFFNLFHSLIKNLLIKGWINLMMFDFYKLGYFSKIINQKR